MILIRPFFSTMGHNIDGKEICKKIEIAGRTCYKSEDKIIGDSASKFVKMLVKRGHEAMIEHYTITIKFVCDRGVTHELVRHRLASYAQESTRYCNCEGGVTFIIPPWMDVNEGSYTEEDIMETYSFSDVSIDERMWMQHMLACERTYQELIRRNWAPQKARSVLPNSLKTEIITTANLREWKHILTLRTSKEAHPQIREIMIPLLNYFQEELPEIYETIKID